MNKKFEKEKESIEQAAAKLPIVLQHRLAFTAINQPDFELFYQEDILNSCLLAANIVEASMQGNQLILDSQKLDELVFNDFGAMKNSYKSFALSLAIASWHDASTEPALDQSLVMNLQNPWPMENFAEVSRLAKLASYQNSAKYAEIEAAAI